MRCEVPAIAEGAIIATNVGNLVLLAFLGRGKRNLAVVGLALLLSCCTNERETKILLGIPDTVEQTPDTDADRAIFACRQYGFVPGTQQWDECMKYVGSKRSLVETLVRRPCLQARHSVGQSNNRPP